MKRRLCAVVASLAWIAHEASAQGSPDPAPTLFDTRLMRGGGPMDLSRFERGRSIAPGWHALDVVRNGQPLGRRLVRFGAPSPDAAAAPCIDAGLAEAVGLAMHALPAGLRTALDDPTQCIGITSFIPEARAEYVAESLALHVVLPQAALVHRPRDAIDPGLRDAGIPAFRINYAFNGLHDEGEDRRDTRASARVELGANAAGWRWRHRATHAWASGSPMRTHALSSTLERDLDAFDAQLTLGDFHTDGQLFDTIGLRGVRLATDDRMLPPSLVRYAPVVRGVANSNARVQVRQGGLLLYDTTVAPGPFALRDVQPLGLGGALEVRVVEADGQVTTFAVPHAAIPGLLREGHARFSFAAGQWLGALDPWGDAATDLVFLGTVQRGLRDRLTVRAGTQLAPGYVQALAGIAVSTRAGALSVDRGQSHWTPEDGTVRGHALRLAYAGRIDATGTQVDVATWRHGTDGYRALGEVLRGQAASGSALREHTRTDASLRHVAGRRGGALTLGLVDRTWRGSSGRQQSLRLGWGIALRGAGLLQATFERGLHGAQRSTAGMVSLSLPLAVARRPALLHAHARTLDDQSTLHASASGAFGQDRRHAWGSGVSQAWVPGAQATRTTSGALSTHGRAGRIGTGLSASPNRRQWSATAEGSLLLHPHGATFGMPLGDTVALVRAPHGRGAALLQHPAVRLDRAGRAVVPQLSPYRRGDVGVDPGPASDVQFDWTERSVVPRAGAVVDVFLPTTHAPLHRLRIVRDDGEPVPFAADVRDQHDTSLGTVGRDGIALLRTPADATHLEVHWRDAGEDRGCRIALPQPAVAATNGNTPCTE